MKTKFTLLAIGSLLLLVAAPAPAQTAGTNALPFTATLKYQAARDNERGLGEHALLPPGLKEKMKLTADQRADVKPFEDDFAETSQEYETANQPRIEAAEDAVRAARANKSESQIQAARKQLQAVWAGLEPSRAAAVKHIKTVLTPEQIAILEDPANRWRESHGTEANDPSAN
jgi:hypothetical protein